MDHYGDLAEYRCPGCGVVLDLLTDAEYFDIELLPDDGDGLLTCKVCKDRYTTNADGVCEHCKQQAWLDAHG